MRCATCGKGRLARALALVLAVAMLGGCSLLLDAPLPAPISLPQAAAPLPVATNPDGLLHAPEDVTPPEIVLENTPDTVSGLLGAMQAQGDVVVENELFTMTIPSGYYYSIDIEERLYAHMQALEQATGITYYNTGNGSGTPIDIVAGNSHYVSASKLSLLPYMLVLDAWGVELQVVELLAEMLFARLGYQTSFALLDGAPIWAAHRACVVQGLTPLLSVFAQKYGSDTLYTTYYRDAQDAEETFGNLRAGGIMFGAEVSLRMGMRMCYFFEEVYGKGSVKNVYTATLGDISSAELTQALKEQTSDNVFEYFHRSSYRYQSLETTHVYQQYMYYLPPSALDNTGAAKPEKSTFYLSFAEYGQGYLTLDARDFITLSNSPSLKGFLRVPAVATAQDRTLLHGYDLYGQHVGSLSFNTGGLTTFEIPGAAIIAIESTLQNAELVLEY